MPKKLTTIILSKHFSVIIVKKLTKNVIKYLLHVHESISAYIFYRRLGVTSNLEINIHFDKMQKDMTNKKQESRKVIKKIHLH